MPDQTAAAQPVIRWEQDVEGIVTLTMDDPEQKVNTLNERFTDALAATVDRLEAERDSVRGVLLRSGKRSFLAGGDLRRLIAVTPADHGAFLADLELRKSRTRRLERLPFPLVAVLDGPAMGGGLELALACHRRVAVDVPGVVVGLPEVTLGLLPGGGGVVRLTALLGARTALPLLLSGSRLSAAEAADRGVVDELATDTDDALARARAWILSTPVGGVAQPWDRDAAATDADTVPLVPESDPARARIRQLVADAHGIDVDARLRAESEGLADLVVTPEAKVTIQVVFFDSVPARNRFRPERGSAVAPLTLLATEERELPPLPATVRVAGPAEGADGMVAGVVADAAPARVAAERTRPVVAVAPDAVGDGDLVAEVWPGGDDTAAVLAALASAGILPVLRAAGDCRLADEVRARAAGAAAGEPAGAQALAWLGLSPAPDAPRADDDVRATVDGVLDRVARELADAGLLAHPEDLDVASVRAGGFPAWTGGAARRAGLVTGSAQ